VTGQVADADLGNQFASPVRDGDTITVCGSRRDLPGPDVIRVSSFTSHWLRIHNP
jgi:hypothetical protein